MASLFSKNKADYATTPKRVYVDNGNGTATELPAAITPTGQVLSVPVKSEIPVNIARCKSTGCPVISQSQLSNLQNQIGPMDRSNFQRNMPATINLSETARGQMMNFRAETGAVSAYDKVITLSIINAAAAGGPDTVGIGDGNLLLALGPEYGGVSLAGLRTGVTVNGTFGPTTHDVIRQLTSNNPMDLHELHLAAYTSVGVPDASVYTANILKLARATGDGNSARVDVIPLNQLVTPDTYQTHIRVAKGFRWTLDGFAAMLVTLATGQRLDITMYLSAVAKTYNMNKVQ